jgi:hypothetical protein
MALNYTSSNDTKFRLGRESAFRVLTPKNLKTLSAIRSANFKPEPNYIQSDAYDPSGNVTDVVLAAFAASGALSVPLAFWAASTGISARRGKTKRRSSGRASRASGASSRISSSIARSAFSRTSSSGTKSRKANACSSTCR